MKKWIAGLAFFGCLSGAVFAGANSNTGCGLGSIVISNPNSAVLYALQMTTNVTFGIQSFGITSGTSNCQKSKFVMNERVQEFVAANMNSLHKEIAAGRGESLDTLTELLAVADAEEFKSSLQANYIAIYTHSGIEMNGVLDNISTLN
ncbi:hypothetical protein CCZ01_00425 [Helicobacter monodelphidis]|uniref:DUF3015 family protein n=1 Tax=Helicobacter sp. 15-1451 TaxID=2004995 RepID=UPI000DCC82BE|nr:DUF3015 family protein [Helicobacter sp. 15-1451]RAX59245.1 hypothetical protein CCZ01_00425 [Helicobacter sp. 15-1451]